jgi:hypothetical protein
MSPYGRPWRESENNIKMHLRNMIWGVGRTVSDQWWALSNAVMNNRVLKNKSMNSIDQMSDYQLFKKDSAP